MEGMTTEPPVVGYIPPEAENDNPKAKVGGGSRGEEEKSEQARRSALRRVAASKARRGELPIPKELQKLRSLWLECIVGHAF
jgi:hypothetical protein